MCVAAVVRVFAVAVTVDSDVFREKGVCRPINGVMLLSHVGTLM